VEEASLLSKENKESSQEDNTQNEEDPKKKWFGLLLVIGIALSWVSSTQFAQVTVRDVNCVFFLMWFSTCWNILCFPAFLLQDLLSKKLRKTEMISVREQIPLSIRKMMILSVFFYFLWAIANYCYVKALQYTSVTSVTAIFSITPGIVFVFSIIILRETVTFFRVLAVLFSISGVLCISLAGGRMDGKWVGDVLTVLSSFAAALYKVLFKFIVGDGNTATVSAFLSCIGLFNLLFMWIIPVILNAVGAESLVFRDIPWDFVIGGAILSLIFNFLINFGIAYTYPLYISLGTILGIPLSAIVDMIWRQKKFNLIEAFGDIQVIIGFFLLLVPFTLVSLWQRCQGEKKQKV